MHLILMKVKDGHYLLKPDLRWAAAGLASYPQISYPFWLSSCNFDRHFSNSLQCPCQLHLCHEYITAGFLDSWALHFLRDFKMCWHCMETFAKKVLSWQQFCSYSSYPLQITCRALSLISVFAWKPDPCILRVHQLLLFLSSSEIVILWLGQHNNF